MAIDLIPVKTPDGIAELASRQRGLSQRHRTVLLLVDGRRTETQVRQLAQQAGVPEHCYDELMALGLILMPIPTQVLNVGVPTAAGSLPLDIALTTVPAPLTPLDEDEPLPASETLQPESVLGDLPAEAAMPDEPPPALDSVLGGMAAGDAALDEARELLAQAVRSEAPVAGSLTLMRLKRARSRDDVARLLGEVASRLGRGAQEPGAHPAVQRARQLLGLAGDGDRGPST